jgi:hypothetical protein
MTESTILDREVIGPFTLEGLSWGKFGHICLTTSLATAQEAAQRLIKDCGFYLWNWRNVGAAFEFTYMHPTSYRFPPDNECENVTIVLVPLSYHDEPRYEVAVRRGDTWVRYRGTTFRGQDQDCGLLAWAVQEYGQDNAIRRPTLVP